MRACIFFIIHCPLLKYMFSHDCAPTRLPIDASGGRPSKDVGDSACVVNAPPRVLCATALCKKNDFSVHDSHAENVPGLSNKSANRAKRTMHGALLHRQNRCHDRRQRVGGRERGAAHETVDGTQRPNKMAPGVDICPHTRNSLRAARHRGVLAA